MKSIPYSHLLSLRQEEIDELTRSRDGFAVAVEGRAKASILSFLENEDRYTTGQKRLSERVAYLWGGRHGFFIIPFVKVWNKAAVNGLKVSAASDADSMVYISFERT